MSIRTAALSALLLSFSLCGSVASAGPPLAEFIPSGAGAFEIDAKDVIDVEIMDAMGTTELKTLSVTVLSEKTDKWRKMTRLNIGGVMAVRICGRIASENVLILSELLEPIIIIVSLKDVEWATAALLGEASCELTG